MVLPYGFAPREESTTVVESARVEGKPRIVHQAYLGLGLDQLHITRRG